jgi:hypothetical protein
MNNNTSFNNIWNYFFAPEQTLFVTEDEIIDAKNNLRKTGFDLTV